MKHLLHFDALRREDLTYLVDPERELGVLFGRPLPVLPQGDEDRQGKKRIFIEFPPNLGVLFRDLLQAYYPVMTGKGKDAESAVERSRTFQEALGEVARETLLQERRHGLYNLFYLSLAKIMAEGVRAFLQAGGRKPHHKYLLCTELSARLSEVHARTIEAVEESEPGGAAFRLGPGSNDGLIHAILKDGLPLVTTEQETVAVEDVLGGLGRRFGLSFTAYKEVLGILSSRIRKGIEEGDGPWLRTLQEVAGSPRPLSHRDIRVLLRRTDVVGFLFMDPEEVGKKMLASKVLKRESVSIPALGRGLLHLLEVLKRNEAIQLLKRNIEVLSERQAGRAEDLYSAGSLYRFQEKGRIVNEARQVTTVFLDLRGFTRKSEEAISAGELTDELYAIFDPMTAIIEGLHGKIDKFTGDGMMVTFGVDSQGKEDPLNALRMAVRIQESLRSLRSRGVTQFRMGVAIHTGVAFVANFVAGEDRVERTVIGRNVNIAGRLSSAGDIDRHRREQQEFDDLVGSLSRSLRDPQEQDRFLETVKSRKSMDKSVSGVSVDPEGNLYNLGIVLSQQTIRAIGRTVELQSGRDGEVGFLFFLDPFLGRRISLYYVGDAKFKGVESAFPVYAVLL